MNYRKADSCDGSPITLPLHLYLAVIVAGVVAAFGCSKSVEGIPTELALRAPSGDTAKSVCDAYSESNRTRLCTLAASKDCVESGSRLLSATRFFASAKTRKRTTIALTAGTYCISKSLRLRSRLAVTGVGNRRKALSNRTTIRMLTPSIPTVRVYQANDVQLLRLNLEQESSEQGMGGGVEIDDSHEVTVKDCSIWQGTFGIMAHSANQPCSGVRITDTLFEYTNSMGLSLKQVVRSEFRNNHIRHAGSDAIKISGGPFQQNLVVGNYLSGSVRDGIDAAFHTNWCTACQNDGICPTGLEACESDLAMCQSLCAPLKCSQGPSRGGFNGNVFANNIVVDNGLLGIAWKLTNGECKDDPNFALGNNVIKDNIVVRNGYTGFEIRGSWVEPGTQPLWQTLPLSKYTRIEGNLSCGNGGSAISVAHAYNVHLKDNWLQGNGKPVSSVLPPSGSVASCDDGAALCADGGCPLKVNVNGQTAHYCPGDTVCPTKQGACVYRRYNSTGKHQLGVALFENRQLAMSGNIFKSGDCSVVNSNYQCPNEPVSAASAELTQPLSIGEPNAQLLQAYVQNALGTYAYHQKDDDGDGFDNAMEAVYFGTDPTDGMDFPSNGGLGVAALDLCSGN